MGGGKSFHQNNAGFASIVVFRQNARFKTFSDNSDISDEDLINSKNRFLYSFLILPLV